MRAESEKDGLVILGPLGVPFVSVTGEAQALLGAVERGVASPPGTMAYRELSFARGGTLAATVSIDGAPAPKARCLLVSATASSRRLTGALAPDPDVLSESRTDAEGLCRTCPVAEGEYIFRVIPVQGGSGFDEPAEIRETQTTTKDIALARIPVRGTVRRGGEPLAGATVITAPLADLPHGETRTTFPKPLLVVTDEEGRYAGWVWTTGTYSFEVTAEKWTVLRSGSRRVRRSGGRDRGLRPRCRRSPGRGR